MGVGQETRGSGAVEQVFRVIDDQGRGGGQARPGGTFQARQDGVRVGHGRVLRGG